MKEFLNRVEAPSDSMVISVSLNKHRTGILIECQDYLAYLPLASKNAQRLLDLLRDFADSESAPGLQVQPDTSQKTGFRLTQLPGIQGIWSCTSDSRYVFEDSSLEEDDWDLPALDVKKTKARTSP